MPGEMRTKQTRKTTHPKTEPTPTKLNAALGFFVFVFLQRNKQNPPPELPVGEVVEGKMAKGRLRLWVQEGGGQGLGDEQTARARPREPAASQPGLHHNEQQRGQMDKHSGHVPRAGVGGWEVLLAAWCRRQGPGEESRRGQTAWGRRAAHGSVPPTWAHTFPPGASVLALPGALGQEN